MTDQHPPGQQFGQYQLRELLGRGGMGAVYRAYQETLSRTVAIKIMSATIAANPDNLQRFIREAKTSAALEHPHIVPIYDYGSENNTAYVVMRLLTGGSLHERLRQRVQQNRPLPTLREVSDLLLKLGSALDYAHDQGVIHRDIKSSNIMFDQHGNPFLVDFGIAKLLDASVTELTAAGGTLGTPTHMAPEQWRGTDISPATDQYALAVVVYEMLTGDLPFTANTPAAMVYKHLNEMPTPPHVARAGLPEAVTAALERALAKEPGDRFQTITAFAQALQRAGTASAEDTGSTQFFTYELASTAQTDGITPAPGSGDATVVEQDNDATIQPTTQPRAAHADTPTSRLPTGAGTAAVPVQNSPLSNPLVWIGGVIVLVLIVAVVILAGSGSDETSDTSDDVRVLEATRTEIARQEQALENERQTQTAIVAGTATTSALRTEIAADVMLQVTVTITRAAEQAELEALYGTQTAEALPSATPTQVMLAATQPRPSATATPTESGIFPALTDDAATREAMPSATATPTESGIGPAMTDDAATREAMATPTYTPTESGIGPAMTADAATREAVSSDVNSIAAAMTADAATREVATATPNAVSMAMTQDVANNNAAPDEPAGITLETADRITLIQNFPTGTVYGGALCSQGQTVITANTDNRQTVWDMATGSELYTFTSHQNYTDHVACDNGTLYATGGVDPWVYVYEDSIERRALEIGTPQVFALTFSPDGNWLAVAHNSEAIVWDLQSGEKQYTLTDHTNTVFDIAFSPDTEVIVTASADQSVRVWDTESGAFLYALEDFDNMVEEIEFSPDGRYLVTLSPQAMGDDEVRIWDVETSETITGFDVPINLPLYMAYHPEGSILAVAGLDMPVLLYNAETGIQIAELTDHSYQPAGLAFTPDGRLVVMTSAQLYVYGVE